MIAPEKINFQLPQYIRLDEFDILIQEEIGSGGFGSVYLAEYEGDLFAVKLYRMWEILPEERSDILKRIYQEYKISDKIDSPYVVKILTYQELLGNPLLIMEYCEGGNLRDLIGQQLDFQAIVKIAHDVCQGLAAMHHKGIVHRDIKPENVLVKPQNYCITDFGISANLHHRLTQRDIRGKAKQVFATAAYSPPEQSNGAIAYKSTGPTNDIYALGVLLYEVLTGGELPYGSFELYEKDPLQYEAKKKEGTWGKHLLYQMQVDALWTFLIHKCLKPKPADRFQSVEEILQQLPHKEVKSKIYKETRPGRSFGWCLEIIEGKKKGLIFYISRLSQNRNKSNLAIGRIDDDPNANNDILIHEGEDGLISRHHATLERYLDDSNEENWIIRDGQWIAVEGEMQWLFSTNGTYVNDESIGRNGVQLKEGDQIRVGRTTLLFQQT